MGRKKKNFNYNPRDVQIAQVQVTPIFYRNMYSTADIVANRGSAGSSKSHSVLQTLVYRFCEQPNKKILILRKTLPSMRLSTLMHLHKIFKEFGISNKVKEEKVTLNYYNNSKASKGYGNLIHLGSVDDKEKIKCVKPETDVLTINGFKNIKKIKVGDKVASVNPKTLEMEYKEVSKTYSYDYDGTMISPINSNEINYSVTYNHTIPMIYDSRMVYVKAENLNGGKYITGNGYIDFKGIKKTNYKGKVYCIEVPPYNNFVSRYKKSVMVTGNSSEWNIIWIEEATEFSYDDFKTISLYNRAPSTDGSKNQVFVSFNPIDEHHWLRTKLLLDERTMKINGVEEIHSTFRDNPFLPEDTRRKYENLVNQDLNYYRIYGLGEWGKLDDLIYSNWDIVPFNLDIEGEVFFGLDFGYNDPSALVKIIVKGDDVWEEELLYESGLNNQQLVNKLKEIIPSRLAMRPMYCDSAEPDKIDEIRKAGFNARPANKSVLDGIDFVKRMKCHVFDNSPDIIKEKRSYSWCKDKEGHPIDKPVDFMDHLMSAERYAIFTPLRKRQAYSVVWL